MPNHAPFGGGLGKNGKNGNILHFIPVRIQKPRIFTSYENA